jgi:hypothetical protein
VLWPAFDTLNRASSCRHRELDRIRTDHRAEATPFKRISARGGPPEIGTGRRLQSFAYELLAQRKGGYSIRRAVRGLSLPLEVC